MKTWCSDKHMKKKFIVHIFYHVTEHETVENVFSNTCFLCSKTCYRTFFVFENVLEQAFINLIIAWNTRGLPCMEHPRKSMHGASADVHARNIRRRPCKGTSAGLRTRNIRGRLCMDHPRMSMQGASADNRAADVRAQTTADVPCTDVPGCSVPDVPRTNAF